MRHLSHWAGALALACALAACRGEPADNLLKQAEALYLEGRFQDAVPVLKAFLLREPFDPGGHLYLGMCYALSDQWLTPAEGEIKTAITLFERNGRKSTIERFPDDYFLARCHLELLKIADLQLRVLLHEGFADERTLQIYIDKFKDYLAKAKELAGEEPYVQECEKLAQGLDDGTIRPQRRRPPQMPPYMMIPPGMPPGVSPGAPPSIPGSPVPLFPQPPTGVPPTASPNVGMDA